MSAAGIVAAMACGGGGSTSGVGVAVGTPGAGGPTGIGDLDHLIQSARDGNFTELASLAGYQWINCTTSAEGASPKCRGNEPAGTSVEVLATSSCQRGWIRPEQVSDALRELLPSGEVSVFAVYRPNDDSDTYDGGFGSQYVAVLSAGKRSDGKPAGVGLHVTGGRVTWLEHECSEILELIATSRVKSFIIPPVSSGATQTGGTPPAGTTSAASMPSAGTTSPVSTPTPGITPAASTPTTKPR